jgi:hypothetical protein
MNKLVGWLALGIGFALAVGMPLILAGVDKDYVWPIALLCSAVLLIARPGGTVEKCLSLLFSYGIVFSVWCVAGVLLVVLLALVFDNVRPPDSLFIVAAVGAYGVYREVTKERRDAKRTNSDA